MVNDQLLRVHQLKQLLILEKNSPKMSEGLCDSDNIADSGSTQELSDQHHSSSPQLSQNSAETCKQVNLVTESPPKNNNNDNSNTSDSNNASPTQKSGMEKVTLKKQNSNSSGASSNQSSKRRSSWRNLLTPSYKSRSDEFHKLFCDKIPKTERLIADYACALHREILIQGRIYISINYIAFYSNLFSWITKLVVRLRDVSEIYKANTARIIPNAIQIIRTNGEKHVFASFVARDKSYVMMLRIWQNNLMNERMTDQEIRNLVHFSYGKDLGMNDNEELKINSPDPVTPANVPIESPGQSSQRARSELSTAEQVDRNNNSNSSQQLQDKDSEQPSHMDDNTRQKPGHSRYNSFDYNSSTRNSNQNVVEEVVGRLNELSSSFRQPEDSHQNDSYSPTASSAVVVDTPPVIKRISSPIPINNDGESIENRHSIGASSTETRIPNDIAEEDEDFEDSAEDASTTRRDGEELIELTTTCGCQEHQGQMIIDQEFDINVDTLFTLIFTNSKFMRTHMIRRGMTDAIISGWKRSSNNSDKSNSSTLSDGRHENRDGAQLVRIKQVRQLNYSLNINHIWAKQVQIEERQNIHQVKPGVYVLKSQTKNSGIPYGETFTVDTSFCLTTNGDINKSRMLIHSFVNFNKDKQNWKLAMVKSMIERQCLQGVNEFIGDLTSSIQEYISKTLERSKNSEENLDHNDEKLQQNDKVFNTKYLHQYKKAPLDSRKSSLSHHSNARYQHHYRPVSLARAKSKLKEEKLKNIYRYYIHNDDDDGDIEGGSNLHCFEGNNDDDRDNSIGFSDTGSSIPPFSDNGSMIMMMHGTDDQVSDNNSVSFHGASEELERNASWLVEDNGSIDRSFSDVDRSRHPRRSVNKRAQQYNRPSIVNENHLNSTTPNSSRVQCEQRRGRSSAQFRQQSARTSTIPHKGGQYQAADISATNNNSTSACYRPKSTPPQIVGDFRFGPISMKNLVGLMTVALLVILFGMIISQVMIIRRLDALEARFLMKCDRMVTSLDSK